MSGPKDGAPLVPNSLSPASQHARWKVADVKQETRLPWQGKPERHFSQVVKHRKA